MIEIVFLVEDDLDGGYIAKALEHSIFTQADTIDELKKMVRDAVICHFEQSTCPNRIRLQFVREEVLAL
ncbi:MAG: type II toxin-antitoxin system HicB family antitoxin [Microcystaceae cyanobacterium]